MLSRRDFITLLGGVAMTALWSGCTTKPQPLTIGLHIWPGYEPTPLAESLGWLDKRLVKIVQTGSATDSIKLLEEGKIDGAGLTLDEVLRVREMGIPLAVILICDISAGADMFLARADIKTLAGVKGMRVGVEEGALGALMLYKTLENAGLKPSDVHIVSLTVDQHAEAWKRGDIDAAVTYEPAASKIIEMGGHRLFDSRNIPDTILDVLAVKATLLDSAHEEALQHLVAQHLRGLKHINSSVDDAAYRLAPRFKIQPSEVMRAFKGLVLPDLQNNVRLIATENPIAARSAEEIGKTMLEAGILKKPPKLDGLLHAEYLPREESA